MKMPTAKEPAMDDKKPKKVSVDSILSREEKKPASAGPAMTGGTKPMAMSKSESKMAPKGKKAKHKHTHIEHHYDESGESKGHTTRHTPMGGGDEVSYTSPDLDGVHDGLEEHVGEDTPGMEQGGSPDMPQQAAAPAQQPMPMAGAQ